MQKQVTLLTAAFIAVIALTAYGPTIFASWQNDAPGGTKSPVSFSQTSAYPSPPNPYPFLFMPIIVCGTCPTPNLLTPTPTPTLTPTPTPTSTPTPKPTTYPLPR